MASIGNILPTTASNGVSGTTGSSNSQNSSGGANPLANQATFLQLLVAQLQNQDPTQPVDGTTFVTQLATFSDVEQNVGTRTDLDAMSEKYLGTTTPPSASTTSPGTNADASAVSNAAATAGLAGANSLPQ